MFNSIGNSIDYQGITIYVKTVFLNRLMKVFLYIRLLMKRSHVPYIMPSAHQPMRRNQKGFNIEVSVGCSAGPSFC